MRCKSGGAIRKARAGMRAQRISEQDQSCAEQRCRHRPAAETDTGILRLLRLAFVGARTLAASQAGAHVSRGTVRGGRSGSAQTKSERRKFETRSDLYSWDGPRQFRAAVWIVVAAPTLRGVARMGRSAGTRHVFEFTSARGSGGRAIENVAAETFASGAHRRARSNRVRARLDARLRAHGARRRLCKTDPRLGQEIFSG